MSDEKLLTAKDVSDRTGKTLSQVYRLIQRGDLPATQIRVRNTQYRVREKDLKEFMDSGGELSPPRLRGHGTMLRVPEAAMRLGYSVETIRRMCHNGELDAIRGGSTARGHFRIPVAAVEKLLKGTPV